MKCPSCQAENLPDSRFCHKCSTPLSKDLAKPEGKAGALQTSHIEAIFLYNKISIISPSKNN